MRPEIPFSHENAEELNRMTLQVGLVGKDGIVMASDRRMWEYEEGSGSVGNVSKFLTAPGMVCCWSGDGLAIHAAYALRDLDWRDIPNDKDAIRDALRKAAIETRKEYVEYRSKLNQEVNEAVVRKVLVVCHDQLWILNLGFPRPTAEQSLDRAVAGDSRNTCRHFINKYAVNCTELPIDRLITLAAYTVLVAADENPEGVGGLEVVTIPTGAKPVFLSGAAEKDLVKACRYVDDNIRERLLDRFVP